MWYFIHAHDAEGTLAKRMDVRPDHVARLKAMNEEGRLLTAGPLPAIDSEDPGPAGFSGSMLVLRFDSIEDAKAWAQDDPYLAAGVYERVDVYPFKPVLP